MRVLVACEESQAVTIELRKLGHEAYSNDILPCSGGHPEWHIQRDTLKVLNPNTLQRIDLQSGGMIFPDSSNYWDMIIAFPPCTHLAVSGAKHFAKKRADGRQQAAVEFFMMIANADCPKIAIENPVGIMSTEWRKPDQIVQPYMFGDPATKTTCLWLKGLPLLEATQIVERGARHVTKGGKSLPAWYNLPPSENRSKIRSKTFPGIAKAMAEQWSIST